MTPTPPLPSLSRTPDRVSGDSPSGGVGVAGAGDEALAAQLLAEHLRQAFTVRFGPLTSYLALCVRCGDDLAEPYRDEADRDAWAAKHVTETGHVVRLVMAGLEDFPSLHLVGIITRTPEGDFRYVCPAEDCATSCGPFASAAVAIASWRSHGPSRTIS